MSQSDRPNFLVIMTDQQRGDCLGIDGHPALLTPSMDEIAARGTRFRRAYTTCPVCIPARRSFMTGQFPATHGMVGYRDGVHWDAPPTLPDELRKAGYQTGIVGRSMHLHPRRKRYGFETMSIIGGHLGEGEYERFLARNQPEGGGGIYGSGVMHNDWTARPWHLPEQFHPTHWTVNEALRFLEDRDPSCPYFLVVSFIAPHPPLNPPAFYMDRYLRMELPEPHIGDWETPPPNDGLGVPVDSARVHLRGEALRSCRAAYYGLINHVDDQIRRLLNPVGRPIGNNTYVLFTSDHGELLGDHYLFRKSQAYEGSARIPLLINGPGLAKGQVSELPVCLEDIMPTVLDLAGVPIPSTVEGRSLAPVLRGELPRWRPYLHGEHAHNQHFLTDGRHKYIWWPNDGREQFFDLVHDPNELHDLGNSPDHIELVTAWRERLIDTLKNRPEGFTDGVRLIPGQPYQALMPHGGTPDKD